MKKYFILAAAAIAMAACSNDESENIVQNDNAIKLTASIGTQTRANATDGLQDTQFETGEDIFVEAYKTGESSTYTTATYETGSAGAMSGVMYYPSDNSNIDICAFYPSSVNSGETTFSINASQTTTDVANYRSSDLMYATKLTNKAKGSTHALTFNHALSKIIVTIAAGDGVTGTDITNKVSAVKINNTLPTYEFTVSGGEIVPKTVSASGTAADIDITGATKTNHAGIIVPQVVAAGTFITVTYNGNNYTYPLGAATTFVAGHVYTYALTLSTAGVSLSSASINPWDNSAADIDVPITL